MIRSMPGGVAGIKALVDAFHARGVKMLLPFHPWDGGTRREKCGDTPAAPIITAPSHISTHTKQQQQQQPGCSHDGDRMDDADAMAALLLATGADGFNGDTMQLIPKTFFDAAMVRCLFLRSVSLESAIELHTYVTPTSPRKVRRSTRTDTPTHNLLDTHHAFRNQPYILFLRR
jgi:hypothetical protein